MIRRCNNQTGAGQFNQPLGGNCRSNPGTRYFMKMQRTAIGLTVLNFLLLLYTGFRAGAAPSATIAPVLRARALEIVDDNGRVRAMIRVFPASPETKMPDGTLGYPETVLLRLIDSTGAPNVKIAATEDGSVVSLAGESNPAHVQLLARGTSPSLKLVNKDGHEQLIKFVK
jgi:hypothetical protein